MAAYQNNEATVAIADYLPSVIQVEIQEFELNC